MTALPNIALSVRQPWAWAIIHAGKDIENRNWAEHHLLRRRGRVAIHAPQRVQQDAYESARNFMLSIGIECPAAIDLPRCGIIGSVEIVDVVSASASPWFEGPSGLVLKDPIPSEFIWSLGALGYFRWAPTTESRARPIGDPPKWMLHQKDTAKCKSP